jgi:hypothetical protein
LVPKKTVASYRAPWFPRRAGPTHDDHDSAEVAQERGRSDARARRPSVRGLTGLAGLAGLTGLTGIPEGTTRRARRLIASNIGTFLAQQPAMAANLVLERLRFYLGYADLLRLIDGAPEVARKFGLTAAHQHQRDDVIYWRRLFTSGLLSRSQSEMLMSLVPPGVGNFGNLVANPPKFRAPTGRLRDNANACTTLVRSGMPDDHVRHVVSTLRADRARVAGWLGGFELSDETRENLTRMLLAASVLDECVFAGSIGLGAFLGDCDTGREPSARDAPPGLLAWLASNVPSDGRLSHLCGVIADSTKGGLSPFSESGVAAEAAGAAGAAEAAGPTRKRKSAAQMASVMRLLLGLSGTLCRVVLACVFEPAARRSVSGPCLMDELFMQSLRHLVAHGASESRVDEGSLRFLVSVAATRSVCESGTGRFGTDAIESLVRETTAMLAAVHEEHASGDDDESASDDDDDDDESAAACEDAATAIVIQRVLDENAAMLAARPGNLFGCLRLRDGGRAVSCCIAPNGLCVTADVVYPRAAAATAPVVPAAPARMPPSGAPRARKPHKNPSLRQPSRRHDNGNLAENLQLALAGAAGALRIEESKSNPRKRPPPGRVPKLILSHAHVLVAGGKFSTVFTLLDGPDRTFTDAELVKRKPRHRADVRFFVYLVNFATVQGAQGAYTLDRGKWPFAYLLSADSEGPTADSRSKLAEAVSAATSHANAPRVVRAAPTRTGAPARAGSDGSEPSGSDESSEDGSDESSESGEDEDESSESGEDEDESSESGEDESGEDDGSDGSSEADEPTVPPALTAADIRGLVGRMLANGAAQLNAALRTETTPSLAVLLQLDVKRRPDATSAAAMQTLPPKRLVALFRSAPHFARILLCAYRTLAVFGGSEYLRPHILSVWPFEPILPASDVLNGAVLDAPEHGCSGDVPAAYDVQKWMTQARNDAQLRALELPRHVARRKPTPEETWSANYALLAAHIRELVLTSGGVHVGAMLLTRLTRTPMAEPLYRWAAAQVVANTARTLPADRARRLADLSGWPWSLPLRARSTRNRAHG